MTIPSHALSRLAHIMIVSLLTAQFPAAATEAPKSRAVKSVPRAIVPTTDIIPLPLNPILPAGQRLCAARTASGLGYTMLRSATGAMPAEADFVLVNYIGYLAASGTVFDQGMQSAFAVNAVIPGFSHGLQMLAKGGVARFCIPAGMGYGAQDSGPIPANSDLVFQVELVDYKTAAEIDAMRKAEAAEPATPTNPAPPPQ